MNPEGSDFSDSGRACWKRLAPAAALAAFGALLTGCPQNDYTVELKPTATSVERTLTFYRADGSDSNGVPKYLEFPTNELAGIARLYPAGAVQAKGKTFIATGNFAGALPADVGGAGSCVTVVSTLGVAGFYQERFRGHDDLAGAAARRFRAADELADLVIGWSKREFGREHGYAPLRRFLDGPFRNDLKSVALYAWFGGQAGTNAESEFTARVGQYLQERGYFKTEEVPQWPYLFSDNDNSTALLRLGQRLAAEKMELPSAKPLPKSLAVFEDPAAFKRSWKNYLAGTDLYRAQIKAWKKQLGTEPNAAKPAPLDAPNDLVADLLGFGNADDDSDHLTVKLMLPHAPDESNGEWQNGQVVWSASLGKNLNSLPVFCCAQWSEPAAAFQTAHFGRVLLTGKDLSHYCVWEKNLSSSSAWKDFLAQLQPGPDLKRKLEAFHFAADASDAGRKLLASELDQETGTGK